MYEHRSTKRVKIPAGHLYPSFSRATVPKCGAPSDHVAMAWIAKVCNGIKQYTMSTLPSHNLLVKLLYV